jgi:hypothetical protein
MLIILVVGMLIYLGWKKSGWWTPFAALLISSPLIALKLSSVNSWRAEAGLSTHSAKSIILSIIITLVIYNLAYWMGLALTRFFNKRKSANPST